MSDKQNQRTSIVLLLASIMICIISICMTHRYISDSFRDSSLDIESLFLGFFCTFPFIIFYIIILALALNSTFRTTWSAEDKYNNIVKLGIVFVLLIIGLLAILVTQYLGPEFLNPIFEAPLPSP